VVDPGGGGDFTSLSAASAAAASGDILLVRGGDYLASGQGVNLGGDKSLAVVAEAGASVRTFALDVQGLLAGNYVLVQGLVLETLGGARDVVRNTAGPVWLERCEFVHSVGGTASQGGVALEGAASVVFAGCELGPPVALLSDDGVALTTFASRAHLHATRVTGLDELIPAVQAIQTSFLEVFDGELQGGVGPDGNTFHCNGFDGGSALLMRNASILVTLGATIAGGAGGAPLTGSGCTPGDAGFDALLLSGSTRTALAGTAKGYEVSSPVREDELVTATFRGQPGDRVWLQHSPRPAPGSAAAWRDGELLLATPLQTIPIGTIPASGTLVLQVAAPPLGSGAEGAVYFSQALVKDALTGRFVASAPSALVVLDDSL
jgi:hypothetical protein